MNRKNKSRGFGFIELESEEDANGLVESLHELEWEGRELSAKIVPGRDSYQKPAATESIPQNDTAWDASEGGGGVAQVQAGVTTASKTTKASSKVVKF